MYTVSTSYLRYILFLLSGHSSISDSRIIIEARPYLELCVGRAAFSPGDTI